MIIQAAMTYEILFINLLLTHLVLRKKYSTLTTILVLLAFTAIISLLIFIAVPRDASRVWVMLIGVLYIIPLSKLYEETTSIKVIVMLFCWTYTLFLSSISYILSIIIYGAIFHPMMIISQTILLVITIPCLLPFVKKYLLVILVNIDKKSNFLLIVLGSINFVGLIITRYFVPINHPSLFITYIFSFAIIAVFVNVLLYDNIKKTNKVESLYTIAYKDFLTGIYNRHSLFIDAEKFISNKTPFQLVFMDLDNLKRINDEYSHQEGDKYLKTFVNAVKLYLQDRGTLYRISGDEFVCIIPDMLSDKETSLFEQSIQDNISSTSKFFGVSIGSVLYPKDARTVDELLYKADKLMYEDKRSKPKTYRESNLKVTR